MCTRSSRRDLRSRIGVGYNDARHLHMDDEESGRATRSARSIKFVSANRFVTSRGTPWSGGLRIEAVAS